MHPSGSETLRVGEFRETCLSVRVEGFKGNVFGFPKTENEMI